jgi:hypothetical protein
LKEKQRIPLVSTGKLAAGTLAKLVLWRNWRSGETGALAKLALWQTGALAKLPTLWQTGALAKLWQMDESQKRR